MRQAAPAVAPELRMQVHRESVLGTVRAFSVAGFDRGFAVCGRHGGCEARIGGGVGHRRGTRALARSVNACESVGDTVEGLHIRRTDAGGAGLGRRTTRCACGHSGLESEADHSTVAVTAAVKLRYRERLGGRRRIHSLRGDSYGA